MLCRVNTTCPRGTVAKTGATGKGQEGQEGQERDECARNRRWGAGPLGVAPVGCTPAVLFVLGLRRCPEAVGKGHRARQTRVRGGKGERRCGTLEKC